MELTDRTMQMCIQIAVLMGFMLLRAPFCMAGSLVASDVPHAKVSDKAMQIHVVTSGSATNPPGEFLCRKRHSPWRNSPSQADITQKKCVHSGQAKKVIQSPAKPFDMHMLIARLKQTDAIGIFTKLALRSDAIDLTDMMAAYHKHLAKYSLRELRARFNGLLLKVLALLNDDPKLAKDISLARDQIWKSLLTKTVKKATRNGNPIGQSASETQCTFLLMSLLVQEVKV